MGQGGRSRSRGATAACRRIRSADPGAGLAALGAGQAPTRFRVAFIMLASQATALNDNQKRDFEGMVDSYADGFHTGTRQLASFDYILNATQPLPIGSACDMPAQCDPSAPLCQGTGMGGAAICTKTCGSEQDCPANWHCHSDQRCYKEAELAGTDAALAMSMGAPPCARVTWKVKRDQPGCALADSGERTSSLGRVHAEPSMRLTSRTRPCCSVSRVAPSRTRQVLWQERSRAP